MGLTNGKYVTISQMLLRRSGTHWRPTFVLILAFVWVIRGVSALAPSVLSPISLSYPPPPTEGNLLFHVD